MSSLFTLFVLCHVLVASVLGCIHKSTTSLNQNQYSFNAKFDNIIREYEKMHERCHATFSERLSQPHNISSQGDCKYLIFSGKSGFGNRIMALLSSFTVALLTNRTFYIYNEGWNVSEVLCSPFPNSNWHLENEAYSQVERSRHIGEKHFDYNSMSYSYYSVNLPYTIYDTIDFMSPENPYSKILIWEINGVDQYYLPLLFLNPFSYPTLNEWFPDHLPALQLAPYLVHPQDDVWSSILQTWTKLSGTTSGGGGDSRRALIVGAQYRWGYFNFSDDCIELSNFYDSSVSLQLPPKLYIISMHDFRSDAAKDHPTWEIHQDHDDKVIENYNTWQMKRVAHDVWILSLTDIALVTGFSTMAYLISALRTTPVTFFSKHYGGGHDHCYFDYSRDPCCHMCVNKRNENNLLIASSILTEEEINRYDHKIIHCLDSQTTDYWGIQLVPVKPK